MMNVHELDVCVPIHEMDKDEIYRWNGKWQHPTGGKPKIVTLIALGPSRETHASISLEKDPNDMILTDETWTVNRGMFHVKHDLLFVMDHIQGEADRYPAYGAALWRHNQPIITSDNLAGWPEHVHQYPWQEIQAWLAKMIRLPFHGDWWHNSLAYILAYAAFIGVEELRVFGADYHHHLSGQIEDGHPNVAYWVGVLEQAGLVVKPIGTSTFLGADKRDYIYGYRDDPREEFVAKRQRFLDLIQNE